MSDESSEKQRIIDAFLEHRFILQRFLQARFRDEQSVDDILQNVYLKLEKARFNVPVDNPEAFLIKLTNNAALDFKRKLATDHGRDKAWGDSNVRFLGGEAVSEAPSPDQVLDQRMRLKQLARMIGGLPPQCRRVFIAHKLKGLSQNAVAARLNISRSAVEKNISRAMRLLRQQVADEEDDGG